MPTVVNHINLQNYALFRYCMSIENVVPKRKPLQKVTSEFKL